MINERWLDQKIRQDGLCPCRRCKQGYRTYIEIHPEEYPEAQDLNEED